MIIIDRDVRDRLKLPEHDHSVIVIESLDEIDKHIERALCMIQGKEEYDEVIIGVDVGPEYIAYAVVADGEIIEVNKTVIEDFLEKVKSIVLNYPYKSMIIRIGSSSKGPEIALKLHNLLNKFNVVIELVEEESTSKHTLITLNYGRIRDKDLSAAVNISFKQGVKIGSHMDSQLNNV